MAHDPEWHREYLVLENAASAATAAWHATRKLAARKNAKPAAILALEAALGVMRDANKARWDFEMAATKIVDIATLPAAEFVAALYPIR